MTRTPARVQHFSSPVEPNYNM